MASHLFVVIFWCIYCCFDPFYSSFSDCNFGQKLFIISLCSVVMSLCCIIIIILSAYNVQIKLVVLENALRNGVYLVLHNTHSFICESFALIYSCNILSGQSTKKWSLLRRFT